MTAVVVTDAGGGLGRALAIELAARGARVAGIGRDAGELAETAALAGPGFTAVACDVADPASVPRAFAEVRAALGPALTLVHVAAVNPGRDSLEETGTSFMATVAANLGGGVACALEALRDMAEAGEGRILHVGSFADAAPLPGSGAYAVSKGAMRAFSRTLVADLHDRLPGIVVSDWMPGSAGVLEAARWGATLALWREPSLNGTVWERDHEVLPPRSLSRRLADRALRRGRAPRTL